MLLLFALVASCDELLLLWNNCWRRLYLVKIAQVFSCVQALSDRLRCTILRGDLRGEIDLVFELAVYRHEGLRCIVLLGSRQNRVARSIVIPHDIGAFAVV